MRGCNAVFMTAAANPWVIRPCENSKFQMQKMQYLEEYFHLYSMLKACSGIREVWVGRTASWLAGQPCVYDTCEFDVFMHFLTKKRDFLPAYC